MHKALYPIIAAATLALAGTAAFANMDEHEGHDGPPPFEHMLSKLPQDKADMFRATMKQAYDKNHDMAEQMHKLHDDIQAILTAPKFDKEAFLAKHKKMRELSDAMRASRDAAFAEAAGKLSQQDRQTLADSMHHMGHHEHHHGDHGKGDKSEQSDTAGDKQAPASHQQ